MFTDRPGPVDHMVAGAKLAESHTLHSTMQPGGGGHIKHNETSNKDRTHLYLSQIDFKFFLLLFSFSG